MLARPRRARQPTRTEFRREQCVSCSLAGFTIIQVKSLEDAIEWVKRAPNAFPDGETEVEIRKLMDVEDFGDGFTPNPEIAKVKFK